MSVEKVTNHFSHSEFGDQLIEEYNIITVNGILYIYEDGYYQSDTPIIERKMIELFPDIKTYLRKEVLAYIKIKTFLKPENIKIEPYVINLKNTRLDLYSGKMLPFSPDVIDFSRVPVTYDPTAYNGDLDKMLNRVFCGDREIRRLFEEMIGYCLIRDLSYEKAFLFIGSGSNGKSTILNLVKCFLGHENYSSIELNKVTDRFSIAELENKLANIGDDVNDIPLKDTGTLKKIFSGQSVSVERKNQSPFTLRSYATHIYSCNEIPRSYDKTEGFYRRWIIIPFEAKFSSNDPDYDPMIGEKITTDNALSYLLNIALDGLRRLIRKGGFTKSLSVEKTIESYRVSNSIALTWIKETGLASEDLLYPNKSVEELYHSFQGWCRMSNMKNILDRRQFVKEINTNLNYKSKQVRIKGSSDKRVIYFVEQ